MDPDLAILGIDYDDLGDVGDLGALDPEIGAYRQLPAARRHAAVVAHKSNLRRLLPRVPGIPARGGRLQTLPVGTGAFVAGGLTSQVFTVNPQKPFKGRRPVYTEARTGASATGLTTLSNIFVGTNLQQVAIGAMPALMFAPTAFDTDLSLDPCGPGVNVSIQANISANPTMTDRVDFSLTLNGETLG